MLSKKATLAIVVLSLIGSHARGDELLGFDSEAFFLSPDLSPARSVSRAASLPGLARSGVLRLAWIDPVAASGLSAATAREEAVRVLKALDLAVAWRVASAEEPPRDDEIRVILLDRTSVNARRANVLGSTPAHYEGAPYLWIHVPGVLQVLGLPHRRGGVPELRDIRGLGIALGRVIAHEVVHALVPAVPHGEGLMKSSLNQRDLVAPSAPVTRELVAIVRGALAAGQAPARNDDGVLAAEQAQGGRRR